MLENIAKILLEDPTIIIKTAFVLVMFVIIFHIIAKSYPCKETTEKHVRFSDENYNLLELKNTIIKYIKKYFFTSHVENGILKSTRYTSDSPYAEIFDPPTDTNDI